MKASGICTFLEALSVWIAGFIFMDSLFYLGFREFESMPEMQAMRSWNVLKRRSGCSSLAWCLIPIQDVHPIFVKYSIVVDKARAKDRFL